MQSDRNLIGIFSKSYRNLIGIFSKSYRNLIEILSKSYRNLIEILSEFFRNLIEILMQSDYLFIVYCQTYQKLQFIKTNQLVTPKLHIYIYMSKEGCRGEVGETPVNPYVLAIQNTQYTGS